MLLNFSIFLLKLEQTTFLGTFNYKVLVSKPLMCSVQFSCSVVSNSLQPHESQHTRFPCPSSSPGVHPDSCPSSQWCHPGISSSVVPFSSCPQFLPASESFPMSQLFAWGGQSTGVSALASFLPKKSQGWSPSEWTGWMSYHRHLKYSYGYDILASGKFRQSWVNQKFTLQIFLQN